MAYKILALLKNQAVLEILALFKKSGRFEKYWRFYKNQAVVEKYIHTIDAKQVHRLFYAHEPPSGYNGVYHREA